MNTKEYTYDIGKYTIGVDKNGEDGIGMTVARIENGEIYFLGNCYGENARCIDLLIKENQELKEKYLNAVADYETAMAEKSELKKQLEESNELVVQGTRKRMKLHDEYNRLRKGYQDTYKDVHIEIKEYKSQQKEFIKYLEDEIERKNNRWEQLANQKNRNEDALLRLDVKIEEDVVVLQKYKEIIGDDKE